MNSENYTWPALRSLYIPYIYTYKTAPTIPCTTCKWSSISKICNRESMKRIEQENRSGFVALYCTPSTHTHTLITHSFSLSLACSVFRSFWVMSWFQQTKMLNAQHTIHIQCSVKIQLTQQKIDDCGHIVNLLVHSMHCLILCVCNVTRWPLSNGAVSLEPFFFYFFFKY